MRTGNSESKGPNRLVREIDTNNTSEKENLNSLKKERKKESLFHVT